MTNYNKISKTYDLININSIRNEMKIRMCYKMYKWMLRNMKVKLSCLAVIFILLEAWILSKGNLEIITLVVLILWVNYLKLSMVLIKYEESGITCELNEVKMIDNRGSFCDIIFVEVGRLFFHFIIETLQFLQYNVYNPPF